ncbi:MAG TPA: alpha-xylosidase, partial [Clostridiaceae bacterium]|nr:alpha-xylosidase [Clostridiaceae bacterium]
MEQYGLLNDIVDVSKDFYKLENNYFIASRVLKLEEGNQLGLLEFRRYSRKLCLGLSQASLPFEPSTPLEYPIDYGQDLKLPFSISLINSRTIRLRISARNELSETIPSLMIEKAPETGQPWECSSTETFTSFKSECGSLVMEHDPFSIILKDSEGRLLTKTQCISDSKNIENAEYMPFSVVRRSSDMKRMIAASFSLGPGEKIFGCGESFTKLDKRGQMQFMYTVDAKGVQTHKMYKPVPFFISSRGYGMFVHSSAPMTFDIGCTYDAVNTMYIGDDQLDLFVFLGTPKEILSE